MFAVGWLYSIIVFIFTGYGHQYRVPDLQPKKIVFRDWLIFMQLIS